MEKARSVRARLQSCHKANQVNRASAPGGVVLRHFPQVQAFFRSLFSPEGKSVPGNRNQIIGSLTACGKSRNPRKLSSGVKALRFFSIIYGMAKAVPFQSRSAENGKMLRTHLINIVRQKICETGIAQGVSADRYGRPLGTDRRTVGVGRADPASCSACGQPRTSVARYSSSAAWRALDTWQRRTVV